MEGIDGVCLMSLVVSCQGLNAGGAACACLLSRGYVRMLLSLFVLISECACLCACLLAFVRVHVRVLACLSPLYERLRALVSVKEKGGRDLCCDRLRGNSSTRMMVFEPFMLCPTPWQLFYQNDFSESIATNVHCIHLRIAQSTIQCLRRFGHEGSESSQTVRKIAEQAGGIEALLVTPCLTGMHSPDSTNSQPTGADTVLQGYRSHSLTDARVADVSFDGNAGYCFNECSEH